MNRPMFCVGEEVMIRSQILPELNTDKTEVLRIDWRDNSNYTGYAYHTAESDAGGNICPNTKQPVGWRESTLRKLPPEDRTSWEEGEGMILCFSDMERWDLTQLRKVRNEMRAALSKEIQKRDAIKAEILYLQKELAGYQE